MGDAPVLVVEESGEEAIVDGILDLSEGCGNVLLEP
jgi:hypothetical protein